MIKIMDCTLIFENYIIDSSILRCSWNGASNGPARSNTSEKMLMQKLVGKLRLTGLIGFTLFIIIVLVKSSDPGGMELLRNSLYFRPFNLISLLFVITLGSFTSIVIIQLYRLYVDSYHNDDQEDD